MLKPQFPYPGNQVIISSGRVLLHAKDDAVFIFGKKGVGISTPATFNIDAPERTVINSNIIELGLRAQKEGYRVVKGEVTLIQLNRLFDSLAQLGEALENIGVELLPEAVSAIQIGGGSLRDTVKSVKNQLSVNALSNITYTL